MEKPHQLLLFPFIQPADETGNPYIMVRQDTVHLPPALVGKIHQPGSSIICIHRFFTSPSRSMRASMTEMVAFVTPAMTASFDGASPSLCW